MKDFCSQSVVICALCCYLCRVKYVQYSDGSIFLYCSSTRWLPTKSCWCDRSSRGARCPGVPTSPWTSWTHHIVEKRWDKHWRQRWEDHSKTLLDLHSGLWLLILPHWLKCFVCKDVLKCAGHNDPVMQVKSLPSLLVERSIALAHYSRIAITQPKEAILVAATFNDYGRWNWSCSISRQQCIDYSWPADEINQ